MNSRQLHLWILDHLEPAKAAALEAMEDDLGASTNEGHWAFELATGRHQGLSLAVGALLELVQQLQSDEQDELDADTAGWVPR